jgi:hypothetical protein
MSAQKRTNKLPGKSLGEKKSLWAPFSLRLFDITAKKLSNQKERGQNAMTKEEGFKFSPQPLLNRIIAI